MTIKRSWAILGLVAIAGLAFALFGSVTPGADTGDVVEAGAPGDIRAEFIHSPRPPDGSSVGTLFCLPEDAQLIKAEMLLHTGHGHIVQVRALPRFDCFVP